MSAYGQSIPAKAYLEYTTLSLTRQAFVNRICRMMDAVGMVYLESMELGRRTMANTTNLLDPANAEVHANASGFATSLLAFDYPTSETFVIKGIAYRPFVYIALDGQALAATASEAYMIRQVNVRHGLRLAGPVFDWSACLNWNKLTGLTDMAGFLPSASQNTTYGMAGHTTPPYTDIHSGMGAALASWKISSSDATTPSAVLLTATRWFAYLGPAGFVLSVGSGDATAAQDKSSAFNIMNVMFLFGGARLPNRARAIGVDYNINRIDPIIFIPAYASASRYDAEGRMYHLLAVQHDLKSSVTDGQPVYCRLYNFDNADAYLSPEPNRRVQMRPIPSPRLVNGAGRHVLSRVVCLPVTGYTLFGAQYSYCPYDDDYNISLHTWADAFTPLSVRFTDNRAPFGLLTDPDTGIPWWIHYWNAADTGIALLATGLTQISTLPTRAYGAATSYAFATIPGPLPAVTTVGQIASSPSALYAYLRYNSGTTGQWTLSGNNLTSTILAATTSEPVVRLEFDLPAGDVGDRWMLQFDASLRGGTENSASMPLSVDVYDNFRLSGTIAGWTSIATYLPAGVNTGHSSYTFSTRTTVPLRIGPSGANTDTSYGAASTIVSGTRLIVQFRLAKSATGGTDLVATIGNFVLLRSRWQ